MSSSKGNCATGSSPEQKAAFNVCYRQAWRNRACPCSKLEPLVKAANSARISFKCLLSISYVKHYMPNEWSINRTKYESSSNFDLWKGDYRGLHCTNKSLFRKFLFFPQLEISYLPACSGISHLCMLPGHFLGTRSHIFQSLQTSKKTGTHHFPYMLNAKLS